MIIAADRTSPWRSSALMSSFHNTSRSSPGSTPTSTSSSLPSTTRSAEIASNPRQSAWPPGPYDPFGGLPQQDRPRAYPEARFAMTMTRPEQQNLDPRVESMWPGIGSAAQQEENFISTSPTAHFRRDRQQSFSREDSPVHVRQSSWGTSDMSRRSTSMSDYSNEPRRPTNVDSTRGNPRPPPRRRQNNPDEFEGPSQFIPQQPSQHEQMRAQALPQLPTHLGVDEQDEIFGQANDVLAQCAFYFVARYQFPIPLEPNKPQVRFPNDREWSEWAYLLKRLATKRRIPARVLLDNQIKQLVTTLENSISVRQSLTTSMRSNTQAVPARAPRDDRYVLQMISSGIQVAKILKDSLAMSQLDDLYKRTENVILERRGLTRMDTFSH